jgi:hypothetical protein
MQFADSSALFVKQEFLKSKVIRPCFFYARYEIPI